MAIPPANSATTPQPVPAPGNTGTILQLPPSLANTQVGDILQGTVAARLPNSAVTIETPAGPLILRTGLPLPPDTAVLIRIVSGGNLPAVMVTVATQPSTGARAPAPSGGAGAVPQSNAAADNVITALVTRTLSTNQADTTAPAFRVAGAPLAGNGPGASAFLPAGTKLPVRIVRVVPPSGTIPGSAAAANLAAAAAPSAGRTVPGAAASAARGNISGAVQQAPAHGTGATTASAGAVQQASAHGAGATTASAAASTAAFSAKIMGTNVVGQPVVRTGNLELTLTAGRPLPTGGTLFLERAGVPLLPALTSTEPQTLAVAQRWEALLQALNNNSSPTLRAAIQHLIPQPNVQLAGTLLYFMAALRGGDPRNWLGGDVARQLNADGLLGRIGEEFGLMQRLATEPAGQDWRLFLIPLLSDGQLQQLRLFVRGRPDNGGDKSEQAGVRFVIEASFSRLGPFQFDGLVQATNMNLVIRTEQSLTEQIRKDIMNIYGTSLQALGFTGRIEFRAEQFFEVQPLAESGLAGRSEVVT
ncbi:MAG: hypothetical protein WD767_17060 [Alphaproteobacteria bacterium]